jgi:sulfur relay (sulfurtransferase) DsrC/TusE family protein
MVENSVFADADGFKTLSTVQISTSFLFALSFFTDEYKEFNSTPPNRVVKGVKIQKQRRFYTKNRKNSKNKKILFDKTRGCKI